MRSIIPHLLTEREAARILACSVSALRKWRREGRGPQATHIERLVRYDVRVIERFLANNRAQGKKAADSRSAAKWEVRNGDAATRS
jgi:hypothetical protein